MILNFDNFKQNLNEQKETYSYGCAMLYVDFPKMAELHKLIDPQDVYLDPEDLTFGLEDEPHVTLLYGLHEEVSLDTVKSIVENHNFGPIVAFNASIFEPEKYDVLKFDIRYPIKGGAFLHKCNQDLVKLPHTTDFPNYHPHMTVAYIKKGLGQKYVDKINGIEYDLEPTYVVYSTSNGEKHRIEINN